MRHSAAIWLVFFVLSAQLRAADVVVSVDSPMSPPNWALLERELLRAHVPACQEFFGRYFDDRGYLLCVERWGGNDGPDDAIENVNNWPILHALGADDSILHMYKKAWEGHLRQYTEAKTVQVPFARDGMYYKEFPVMFDWVHNGEGLTVFNLQGLSDPLDRRFQRRVRRFAGFYMNEDPQAPNYDPEHKIIRSLFNGSRGPLLRKATGLDWAGDPIEVKDRFNALHGEDTYAQFIEHFKDYNDIVGDHPQNLAATSLALNAYMLTGEEKYKAWLLEYVDAWVQRVYDNGGIIPTNVGLDGVIGSAAGGKWYGGVYGWGFTVAVPQTPGRYDNRNTHGLGLTGFGNAYMLTGDDRYLQVWRQMIDRINSNHKIVDGKVMYPRMYGDDGWYAYSPSKYSSGAFEIYYWSQKPADRARVTSAHLDYLEGRNDGYPEAALQGELETIRRKVQAMRADRTTPDTRLADEPMGYNPATTSALIQLMLGGFHPGHGGRVLHSRLRYFDPVSRRAGVPSDVGALVEKMDADSVTVTLVNVSQTEARQLVVQAGSYAEHQFVGLVHGEETVAVDAPCFTVRLAPGCGTQLSIKMKRYANQPTMALPWDRAWMLSR